MRVNVFTLLAIPSFAFAADIGAGVPTPSPVEADLLAPLTFPSTSWEPGTFGAGLALRFVSDPVVVEVSDGSGIERIDVLGDAVGLEVGLSAAPFRRLTLGAGLPIWLTASGTEGEGGAASGDLSTWASMRILSTSEGFAASLVPTLTLPTGAEDRELGRNGVSGGIAVAGSTQESNFSLGIMAGLGWRPASEPTFLAFAFPAGVDADFGGALVYRLAKPLAVGGELRARFPLASMSEQSAPALGTPIEGSAFLRVAPSSTVILTCGARARAFGGVYRAPFSAFVALSFHRAPARSLHSVEAESTPEDAVLLHVVDPRGIAIRNAAVRDAGGAVLGHTDANGDVHLSRWKREITVDSPGLEPIAIPQPEGSSVRQELSWAKTPIELRVTDETGRAIPAELRFDGPEPVPAPAFDDSGKTRVELSPGTWNATIEAQGFSRQEREIVVSGGRIDALHAEVVLSPPRGDAELALEVVDVMGSPVEGALILIDGRPVGTTPTGGRLLLTGMAAGPHELRVESDVLELTDSDVNLEPGPNALFSVALPYREGSVRVRVRGPEAAAVDALARFDGPSRLPAMPLGVDGERLFALQPGTWTLFVSSPLLGMQQRDIIVPENARDPIEVDIVLQPAESGAGELVVEVVDRDGAPIGDVEISLDGRSFGSTSTGGKLRLPELRPGVRELEVEDDRFVDRPAEELLITEGFQQHPVVLSWKPGSTEISVHTPESEPVDAVLRLSGPSTVTSRSGSSGVALLELAPGRWDLLASSERYGFQMSNLDIAPDNPRLTRADVILRANASGRASAAVRVLDPDERPVEGAEVLVDGEPAGRTAADGALRAGPFVAGKHEIEVRDPRFAAFAATLELRANNAETRTLQLQWATGLVLLRVRSNEGTPVTDALLRVGGPRTLPPLSVETDGSRLLPLGPGRWQVIVSSTSRGFAQREIVLTASDFRPRTEEVVLGGGLAGTATLLVRVTDPMGRPVPNASVFSGDALSGITSSAGAVLVAGLAPGPVLLRAQAPGHETGATMSFELESGSFERFITLRPLPGRVRFRVADATGQPLPCELRFDGPEVAPPLWIGPDGTGETLLYPGAWRVFADAPGFAIDKQALLVAAGADLEPLVFELHVAKVSVEEKSFVVLEKVHFETAQANPSAAEKAVLDEVAATLLSRSDLLRVEIQGHTDSSGDLAYNMTLSTQRAETVRQELISRGVPREQVVARGYGPLKPRASNATEEGMAENRRVEFVILEASSL